MEGTPVTTTQYPLLDLTHKFAQDVQAVSAQFQESVSEASREILKQVPEMLEAAQSPAHASRHKAGSGAAAGKTRLDAPAIEASPLKRSKQDGRSQPAAVCSPAMSRSGQKRSLESSSFDSAPAAPRPQVSGLLAASASPRQGGCLLDAMRARGTFGGASPAVSSTPPNPALVPASSVSRALTPQRSSSDSGDCAEKTPAAALSPAPRVPKRPRENSMVALYKAMVEPQLQIDIKASATTPLSNKIASAKKFRRSSMMKQAAALRMPPPMSALAVQPAVTKIIKTDVAAAPTPTKASSSTAVPSKPVASAGTSVAEKTVVKATGVEGGKRIKGKTKKPPVPAFSSPQPPAFKRLSVPIAPKTEEDNYEISDKDENSDDNCEEPDRSHKHVPGWCSNYLEVLAGQNDLDPDTIFGSKVPRCDLDLIFSDDLYRRYSRVRPQRRRGSSCQWQKDRLRQHEIRDYKKKMGQVRPWNTPTKSASAAAASGGPPVVAH